MLILGCEDNDFYLINHYFFNSGPIKLTESINTFVLS